MSTSYAEGDPGKLAYFKNPNWTPSLLSVVGRGIRPKTFCAGCYFGEGRPHEDSDVCQLKRTQRAESD